MIPGITSVKRFFFMKHRKAISIIVLAVLAVALMSVGLLRVVRVYRNYRADMLNYESRHINSIISASARGLNGTLEGYAAHIEQLLNRREFNRAEEEYAETGDALPLRALMARPDVKSMYMTYSIAVYDGEGTFLAATDAQFPQYDRDDEVLRAGIRMRADGDGKPWFIFGRWSDGGLYYELAIPVQSLFSYQADAARIGQRGYLFMLDREGRFFSYSGEGNSDTVSTGELADRFPNVEPETLKKLAASGGGPPPEYGVYRYPWGNGAGGGDVTDETLVVTCPISPENTNLVMGAAVSFQEFNAFLTDTLHQVAWIILTEIGGAMILFLIAAWLIILSRRNSLELQAVRERADLMEEINRQQQSLARTERLQQLGVMTSGIVHEFNNMLTPIMSQSLLLLEELADYENTPQFENALDIYEAAENARDVLRRMSIMGKKDVDMGFRPLDICGLLKKTMNLAAMAKDPHILQELELPEEPVFISGNEQLLTQAFLNLCINACQAMGDEGTLTVTAAPESRSGRSYIRVEVRDTGPGISEEKIGSIYEPFYTTKGEGGTGLGLAICQKIIETHKGTISAANGEERGAVFTVRIPTCGLPEEE